MNAGELVAAYVLGELDGPELADFERRLAAEPGLRAEVEAARGTIAGLKALPRHAWPGAEPVDAVERAVDGRGVGQATGAPMVEAGDRSDAGPAALATAGATPRETETVAGGRRALALAAALLAAVFLLGGIAGALIFSGDGSSPSTAARTLLVLHPLDAPRGSRADISMPDADTMLLRAHGLPASAAGSYYEVWLMSSARKLVPVASFRVGASGEASVEVPLPASPADYRYFDVSRQSVAGGLAHSSDSVLRGATGGLS